MSEKGPGQPCGICDTMSLHNTLTLESRDSTFLSNLGGDLLAQQSGHRRFLARIAAATRGARL